MSVHLVFDGLDRPYDGIAAFSRHLARHLPDAIGAPVTLGPTHEPVPEGAAVQLQYNPFSFGARGVAPGLLRFARGHRLHLMVHEPYLHARSPRAHALEAAQRVQLRGLRRRAATVVAPSADAARRAGGADAVIPAGSNLPDRREARAAVRDELGLGEGDLAVGLFAGTPAGRLEALVAAALTRCAARVALVLLLGRGAGAAPPGVRAVAPGAVPDARLAELLAACDVLLAPFDDGVSTRRTTLAAALQHGIPVVGTDVGRSDPQLLDRPAIRTAGPADDGAFAAALDGLLRDDRGRAEAAADARRLFDEHLAWPVIAARHAEVLRDG